jgi:hypothetical protein
MRGRGLCKQQNCTLFANPLDSFWGRTKEEHPMGDNERHALTANSAPAAKRFEAIAANLK